MSSLFTIIFIISCIGVWYFIKKSPNRNNRNIAIGVAIISMLLVGVTSPSSDKSTKDEDSKKETVSKKNESKSSSSKKEKSNLQLSLNSTDIETDDKGNATITGKTSPKANVSVGMGIVGDSTEADSNGDFSLNYELSGDSNKEITIYSTLDGDTKNSKVTIKPNAQVLAAAAQKKAADEAAKKQAEEQKAQEASIPTEYKSALRKAESYSNTMHMSRAGIYDQLSSDYGEQFTPEAAQYAVDNLKADYNANALEKAKSYQDKMSMSPEAIRDQLTSDAGEKFTPEEADYAIQNLNQ
ncbi:MULTISPECIES: Ltp family lipoprotein [Enterococcus]|uniref:Ltp family lipoprotein n=1 Tax=Enterococcus sp. TaxID=35783 RepID=UPI0022E8F097|nr:MULTISPECIES: Ltp family lipoprotein [Enterococcus]